MKVIFVLILFVIIVLYPSCREQNSDYRFVEEGELSGNEILLDTLMEPWCLDFLDTFLIVKEPYWKNENGFKIINAYTFKFITDMVKIGSGPGELINPGIIVVDEYNREIWCPDLSKKKYYNFSIDSLISNPYYESPFSFDIYIGFMPMSNVFFYSPSMFGFTSFNLQQYLVSFINSQGELIDSLCIPNKILPKLWDDLSYSDNPLIVRYSESRSNFVVASRFSNYLAVIDENGNPLFESRGVEIEGNETNDIESFYDIRTDEDYIYCLYIGKKFLEYSNNQVKVNYPARLLIFDWEGKGRYNISLDHPIMFFDIDKTRNVLVGSTPDFDNGIVEYELAQLKNSSK